MTIDQNLRYPYSIIEVPPYAFTGDGLDVEDLRTPSQRMTDSELRRTLGDSGATVAEFRRPPATVPATVEEPTLARLPVTN